MQLAFFICLAAVGCTALSVDKFIPFGTANGDTVFFSNDDNTTSVSVPVRFPFYDRLFTTIHVRRNDCIYLCMIIVTTMQCKLQYLLTPLCVATGRASHSSATILLYSYHCHMYNQTVKVIFVYWKL